MEDAEIIVSSARGRLTQYYAVQMLSRGIFTSIINISGTSTNQNNIYHNFSCRSCRHCLHIIMTNLERNFNFTEFYDIDQQKSFINMQSQIWKLFDSLASESSYTTKT